MRNCVLLGALLSKSLYIHSMRGKRSKPGLAAQHLTGIQLVGKMTNAKLRGAEKDSQELWVTPETLRGGEFLADTHTAGSVALIVQISFPCALFCDKPSVITCRGGTNAIGAPQIDYMQLVFAPIAARMGAVLNLTVNTRGYYPKGQGEIVVNVSPVKQLQPIQLLDPGVVTNVYIRAFVSKLPAHIAERMAATTRRLLERALRPGGAGAAGVAADGSGKVDYNVDLVIEQGARDAATGLIVVATTSTGCILAGSSLGEKGVRAEDIAGRVVDELLVSVNARACVDMHLQDQLIVFMALAVRFIVLCVCVCVCVYVCFFIFVFIC